MTNAGYRGVPILGGSQPRQVNRWLAMFVAVLAVTGLGATGQMVFDVLGWRDLNAPRLARATADDPSETEARQIDALVVMLRDARESVDAMKRARERGGKVAEHAAGALAKLRKAIEEK